mmetsp:Transcript_29569/g.45090  ORF Transcript_29569/g.45090 Transcript_29569/m.45090 type:complete len:212 (+) Transcript_29569:1210-1845(+)
MRASSCLIIVSLVLRLWVSLSASLLRSEVVWLSVSMNCSSSLLSLSSCFLESSRAFDLLFFLVSRSLISLPMVLYDSSTKNISFFWSTNSLMFYGRDSRGNCTRDFAICIAPEMYHLCFELKLNKFSSPPIGLMSLSFTRLRGMREVAVFLSQIFRCLAASFDSFLRCFSASRVMKTCSSLGGSKGEDFSLAAPRNSAPPCLESLYDSWSM